MLGLWLLGSKRFNTDGWQTHPFTYTDCVHSPRTNDVLAAEKIAYFDLRPFPTAAVATLFGY